MQSAPDSPETRRSLGGEGAGKVVFFGSFDESLHPRVTVLREGLEGLGHEITVVNQPLGMSTADKVDAASSAAGMVRLLLAILRAWLPLWRRGRKAPAPDLVVVGYLGHFDIHLARLIWPSTPLALDHMVGLADTARDRGVAKGLKYRVLSGLDNAALKRADTIIVDTIEQLEQLPQQLRDRAVVVPVGASHVWFDQLVPEPSMPLKVCFVGLYTPLHGAVTIGKAIAELAGDQRVEFTMVGSGQDLDQTVAAAGGGNVTWIDWVDAEDLPGLVAAQHVCLGIFGTTPKAQRVVPNKVYQGLAAGNVVVTSDTEAQRRALGDAARFVPPGDHEALARCLAEIADDPTNYGIGTSQGRQRAENFLPEQVVVPLVEQSRLNDRKEPMSTRSNLAAGPALPPNAWLRFDILRGPLEDLPPSTVLEIGPGRGAVASRLVSAGHDYTGVEMSPTVRAGTTELLEAVPGGRSRMLASTDDLSPDELFDVVCAFEVLEHIEDDASALREWVSHLAPGGLLLLSVPAWPQRYSAHDLEVGHIRRYAPEQLGKLATEVGLVDVTPRLYGFPLGFGLESIRNTMSRRIQKGADVEAESALERTQRSSGWFQPPRSANTLIQAGTWPFRLIQRAVPGKGTGLVLVAHKPAGGLPVNGDR